MTYSRPGLSRGARRAAQERPSRSRPGRPRRHEPTRRRANGPKTVTRERSDSEREATTSLKLTMPTPTQTGPQPGRTAAPLGRSGRPECGPPRLKQHGADTPAARTTGMAIHRTVVGPESNDRENRLGLRGRVRDREPGRQLEHEKSQRWNEMA